MATASLKSRIDKLINDLGGQPKPGPVDIRNRLTTFSSLAESLENGQSAADAKAQIEALEKQIFDLESMHSTQLQELQAECEQLRRVLQATTREIKRFKDEEEKRANKEIFSTAERRILTFLDQRGESNGEAVAGMLSIPTESAIGMLSNLQQLAGGGQYVVGTWRNDSYFYSLGQTGKVWAKENPEPKSNRVGGWG